MRVVPADFINAPKLRMMTSAVAVAVAFGCPADCRAQTKTALAVSALELGGTIGKLVWVEVESPKPTGAPSERYLDLANEVKKQIEIGRAASGLVRANFDIVGTSLLYAAAADPEPLSKAVSALAAYGAKKAGDAFGDKMINDAQDRSRGILARGLQEASLSSAQIAAMTPTDLGQAVGQLRIGGQQIATILANDPGSLDLLRANAIDLATEIGVQALSQSKANSGSIQDLRTSLGITVKSLSDYRKLTEQRLADIDTGLVSVQSQITITQQKLGVLEQQVSGNTAAIHSMAEISYAGWSTAQKLQAVQSGLLPGLDQNQKVALIDSLKAQQKQESAISQLRSVSEDLSNLATIAKNVGLPADAVKGLQAAQTIATGVAQFATGNYLGAIASVTSLVGLGGPDAATERHAEMMKYLSQQFAQVNAKLDRVIDLQINTIKLIQALADQQQDFNQKVFGQLDRIEDQVLSSHQISQAILLSQWQDCNGLINGTALNGQYGIDSLDTLLDVIKSPISATYAGGCYTQMAGFLDANVRPANWSGQIIAAANFPQSTISNDQNLLRQMLLFQQQRVQAFTSARDVVLAFWSKNSHISSAQLATRVAQPVYSAVYQDNLKKALSVTTTATALGSFTCNQDNVIQSAMRDLLCFGLPKGSVKAPDPSRLANLLRAALIGPQAKGIIDTGVVLSELSGLAVAAPNGVFTFTTAHDLSELSNNGLPTTLRDAVQQRKGPDLLRRLRWLTTAMTLQQSVTYGDFTAEIVEGVLYNPTSHSLDPAGIDKDLAGYAMAAIRTNPTLARNVVILAARHAIADGLGNRSNAEAALYRRTYYSLGLRNLTGPSACGPDLHAGAVLNDLLPNWKFEYRVSAVTKASDSTLNNCPQEDSGTAVSGVQQFAPRGSGTGVVVGDVYIVMPSAMAVSEGLFEVSDSLREALRYSDRVSQAELDLNVISSVRRVAKDTGPTENMVERISRGIVSDGWNWQPKRRIDQ